MNPRINGYAMASYYGGRAEVRVRKVDVPVVVVDFTSMYPTVFITQNIQELTTAKSIRTRTVTEDTRRLLDEIQLEDLYNPILWTLFRRLIRLKPNGDILPVRMRVAHGDPFTISVTQFTSDHPYWYTFADVLAAKLLGGKLPVIEAALEFYGNGVNTDTRSIDFLGTVLDPDTQIFKTVIEERQKAKKAKRRGGNAELARRDMALKTLANSGAYGIFAEVNVAPAKRVGAIAKETAQKGVWYSDVGPCKGETHEERPGAFFSPAIASFVTSGARLMLAILETEVTRAGGTFAFCDTDSLAIVAGVGAPEDVPSLTEAAVHRIIDKFNRLNPYDPLVVPQLLKREYETEKGLRCFAVSAKRYVLFTVHEKKRLRIVKASESGIGAAIGRSEKENVRKLARRIWTAILIRELRLKYRGCRARRYKRLLDFNVPFRRKFPIAQPRVLNSRGFTEYNRTRAYDYRIKPFGFLQTITAATTMGDEIAPIAPFERDLGKSRALQWTNLHTGKALPLDWDGASHSGTIQVMRLDEFVRQYAEHPEAKAAGPDGKPSTTATSGVLGRLNLRSGEPARIGKEVDRLDEDDGESLDQSRPIEYKLADEAELHRALKLLCRIPRTVLAARLSISERRLRDIIKGKATPRKRTREAITQFASLSNNDFSSDVISLLCL